MNENYVTDLLSGYLKQYQAELHEIDEFLHREYNDQTSDNNNFQLMLLQAIL